MKRKAILWILGFSVLVISALGFVAFWTIRIDPFFHYHQPRTDEYFYKLNNERSQNDGITKHFDYQGIITGTSMTRNFKTSEAEALWGDTFIKVPFSGASFREINDNLLTAIKYNPNLKIIIRGLDMSKFDEDKDYLRTDLGTFPTYLYDDDPFNDVHYVFNRDVVFSRVYHMISERGKQNFKSGITSFDEYSRRMNFKFGKKALYPKGVTLKEAGKPVELSESDRIKVLENIRQNVTALAEANPDITYYCFFPPYSAKWWQRKVANGTIYRQIQIERTVIEEVIRCKNIKLYSFNNLTNITTDLNNYRDMDHYGDWINSLMLRYMHDDKCLLTADNYEAYLAEELAFYSTYDYTLINDQEDYENDHYAALLFAEETYHLTGTDLLSDLSAIQMSHSWMAEDQFEGKPGVVCRGSLGRDASGEETAGDYMRDNDYVGFKMEIKNIDQAEFIAFYGKKNADRGQPTVYVYNKKGKIVAQCTEEYGHIDTEWHKYLIDVSDVKGDVTIIFNGGYTDHSGGADSEFVFSNVMLY